MSVDYFFGCRKRLFNMINDLPTVFEVVTGAAKKQQKEKSSISNHSSNKLKSNPKPVSNNLKEAHASSLMFNRCSSCSSCTW